MQEDPTCGRANPRSVVRVEGPGGQVGGQWAWFRRGSAVTATTRHQHQRVIFTASQRPGSGNFTVSSPSPQCGARCPAGLWPGET